MKKTRLALVIVLAFFIFPSCKKDTKLPDLIEELVYKTKVEKLLNLPAHTISQKELEKSNLPHLDFNTYKEAYYYFQFLEPGRSFTHVDTSKAVEKSLVEPLDEFYYNYSFMTNAQISTSVSGTFGSEGILLMYFMQYTLSYNPPTVTRNYPSNATAYFTGFGTPGSQRIGILPYSQSSNTGTITGALQVTGTVAGVPYSIAIQLNGSYSFTVPIQDYVYQTRLTTMLSARVVN